MRVDDKNAYDYHVKLRQLSYPITQDSNGGTICNNMIIVPARQSATHHICGVWFCVIIMSIK